MNKEAIIREWFYRLPKGYAEVPYTKAEMNILHEVLKENEMNGSVFVNETIDTGPKRNFKPYGDKYTEYEKATNKDLKEVDQLDQAFNDAKPVEEAAKDKKQELIDLVKAAELNDTEIQWYIKSITNKGFKGDIVDYLAARGYTGDTFKVGDKAIEYIFDKISDSEADEFVKYIENPKNFASLPTRGNFAKETGLSQKLIKDLIDIEPGADAGGSSIGKAEVFLALIFDDIDNRGGGGDLNFKGKNLEVKGTGGRLGQQGGRGSDFNYVKYLGEKFLEGEELENFINNPNNGMINYSMLNIYEQGTAKGFESSEIIKYIQEALDSIYFNKGVAKKYFNGPKDFEDLADMKKSLMKLNAHAYGMKTNVGMFIFLDSRSGDYVLVDIDKIDQIVDAEEIDTKTKRPDLGYKWNNPHPSLIIKTTV